MKHYRKPPARALLAALLPFLATSCLAAAPPASLRSDTALVRADSRAEARLISELAADLKPRLLELLPDSRLSTGVEIWVQQEPSLYAFPSDAQSDAEGLYSADHDRILLARDAEDIERTLAHELTHAALGASWRALPGSLEEGLCDLVSAHISPTGATRLRAGRLCSAALASGGLRLRFELRRGGEPIWSSRMILSAREKQEASVMQVFALQAGLSSTRIATGAKRGYYGLAYLVVARIVERHGLEGLNALCKGALERGLSHIPSSWILEAAELDRDEACWRRAAAASLGRAELADLLRLYPEVIGDAIDELSEELRGRLDRGEELSLWAIPEEGRVEVELCLPPPLKPFVQ